MLMDDIILVSFFIILPIIKMWFLRQINIKCFKLFCYLTFIIYCCFLIHIWKDFWDKYTNYNWQLKWIFILIIIILTLIIEFIWFLNIEMKDFQWFNLLVALLIMFFNLGLLNPQKIDYLIEGIISLIDIDNFVKWFQANFFSISAFVFSAITLFKNRTILKVRWRNEIQLCVDNSVVAYDEKGNTISPYQNVFLTQLEIINPSPNDIAFFDLSAWDTDTNFPLEILSTKAYSLDNTRSHIVHYTNGVNFNILDVPQDTYGVFKANSYTRFNLGIIVTDPSEYNHLKKIGIQFNIAKRAFVKGNKNKNYYNIYNVEGWKNIKYKNGYNDVAKIMSLIMKLIGDNSLDEKIITKNIKKFV